MYQAQAAPPSAVQVTTLGGSAMPSAGSLPTGTAYAPGTTYAAGTAYMPSTTAGAPTYAPSTYAPASYGGYSTPSYTAPYTTSTLAGATYTTSASSPYTGAYAPATYAAGLPAAYGNTYGGYYGSAPVTGSSYAAAPAMDAATVAPTYGTPAMAAATAFGAGSFTAAPAGAQDMPSYTASSAALQPATSMMIPQPMNPLQSAPSMIAYGGGFGLPAMSGYSSAMDGPFKFYATPPGKLPETVRDTVKTDEGAQTGGSLRAGASKPEDSPRDGSGSSKKKYGKKKKSSGCC